MTGLTSPKPMSRIFGTGRCAITAKASSLETLFGTTITNSAGRIVPVRLIGEQHVLDDLGRIPSFADWARAIRAEPWTGRAQRLEQRLAADADLYPPR